MAQEIVATLAGRVQRLALPDPDDYVMDGVKWGDHCALFTPAFWATLSWLSETENNDELYRMGRTLEEEVAACLLGGYGIPAEVGWAAFHKIRDAGLLHTTCPSGDMLHKALTEPLNIRGRKIRYRFARQKANYLGAALLKFREDVPPVHDDLALRDWLMGLPEVGPKTASWITRNWLHSDRVAIIDIHIHRAWCSRLFRAGGVNPDDVA